MKFRASSVAVLVLFAVVIAWTGILHATQETAQETKAPSERSEMTIAKPDELDWQPGPPSLPPGSEFVVLEGDPSEATFFNLRLKLPDGYRIPPHTHPKVERVTVLSGNFRFAMDREFDEEELQDLTAGAFFVMPPGMAHYAQAQGETIVQLNALGPWQIDYINPDDDPRRQQE